MDAIEISEKNYNRISTYTQDIKNMIKQWESGKIDPDKLYAVMAYIEKCTEQIQLAVDS